MQDPVPSPVAVTGAAGFIGSWLVKTLLEAGATVHGTVRKLDDAAKIGHLKALAEGVPGKLELFEAELLAGEGFQRAFAGCRAVVHSASPFVVQGIKDPRKQLIEPALEGTRRVLQAVESCPSVERVVLTSSIAAIHGDASEIEHCPGGFSEEQWNRSSSERHQPYSYSKTVAEEEAWRIAKTQTRWRLITINPGLVVGPALSTRRDATSTDLIAQLLDGRSKSGAPALHFALVDVRDVALAHCRALALPDAEGRHLVAADVMSLPEIAALLREEYGDRYPIPRGALPAPLLYLVGPFMGLSWRFLRNNLGIPIRINNTKSREKLGLEYRPLRQALLDQVAAMQAAGLLPNHG